MEAGHEGEQVRRPRRSVVAAFVAVLALYYAAYYVVFAGRIGEYFGDLLKHFEFVRRLW